jgi:Lrp/AsnC family leucine-responsive transcriptional regulator
MDGTDKKLIAALLANSRLTYAELGRKLQMSAPAVHDRIARLERSGVIRSYTAEIDPAALGTNVAALIGIELDASGRINDAVNSLRRIPEVEDCFVVAGNESIVVKVRVASTTELATILDTIQGIEPIGRTRVNVILSEPWTDRIRLDLAGEP